MPVCGKVSLGVPVYATVGVVVNSEEEDAGTLRLEDDSQAYGQHTIPSLCGSLRVRHVPRLQRAALYRTERAAVGAAVTNTRRVSSLSYRPLYSARALEWPFLAIGGVIC